MSSIVVAGDTSGSITISAPLVSGSNTLTLPAVTDTIAGIAATQTLTNKTLTSPVLTTPALGTPASGVLTNCTGVPAAALPAGSVLQVVSTTKSDTFTSSVSATFTDITGMSVSITPRSTSSKILVSFVLNCVNGGDNSFIRLMRDATPICIGDVAGSRTQSSAGNAFSNINAAGFYSNSNLYLDSPSSVSSVTYKLQFRNSSAQILNVNRSVTDSDTIGYSRTTSTITVQEIQG